MTEIKLEFYFRGGPVGIFQMLEFPRESGIYSYIPYRSGSHYLMHQTLQEFGCAECSYVTKDGLVRFQVSGCPEYGQLKLCDFQLG